MKYNDFLMIMLYLDSIIDGNIQNTTKKDNMVFFKIPHTKDSDVRILVEFSDDSEDGEQDVTFSTENNFVMVTFDEIKLVEGLEHTKIGISLFIKGINIGCIGIMEQ